MKRVKIITILLTIFSLTSLCFAESQPKERKRIKPIRPDVSLQEDLQRQEFREKKIDADKLEVLIPDEPKIQEFVVHSTRVFQGGPIDFSWRVEPGRGGSPIRMITITIGERQLFVSGRPYGRERRTLPGYIGPGTIELVLHATNQIGNTTTKSVNIEVVDEPIIHEFSADPSIVAADHDLKLKWSVRSAPAGSPIKRVTITPDITGDLPSSGERTIRIDANAPGQRRKQYTLTATNEAGKSVSRTVNVEIRSMREMYSAITIRELRTEPDEFSLIHPFDFIITISNASGAKFNASTLEVLGNRTTLLTPDTSVVINPGVNTYTLRCIHGQSLGLASLTNVRVFIGYFTGHPDSSKTRDFSVRQVRQIPVYTVE